MNRVRYRVNEQTLYQINPTAFSVGDIAIFTSLQSYDDIPWHSMEISDSLNRYYYGLHSGDKIISPLVEKIVVGDTITQIEMDMLGKIAHDMFFKRWARLWEVRESEYNPINNYDMVENETINTGTEYDTTHTRTDNLTHAKTGYETITPNLTEQQIPNLNTKQDRGVYGFNSPDAVDADTENHTVTGTNSTTTTGTNRTDYNTTDANTGTETTTHTGTDTDETVRELSRSGNIGVTTSQQMLQSEIELWQWDFFRDVVFPDIDRILTIQIY